MRFLRSGFTTMALCCAMVLSTLTFPAMAEDSQFSAAPSTAPATSATAPAAPKAIVPTTGTASTPPPLSVSDYIIAFVTSPVVIVALAALFLRLESYLATKLKLDVAKARGLAVTIYGLLKDDGYIKSGSTTALMDKFWNELDRQSLEHYGVAASPQVQDMAHATFADLINTAKSGTAAIPPAAVLAPTAATPPVLPMIRNV